MVYFCSINKILIKTNHMKNITLTRKIKLAVYVPESITDEQQRKLYKDSTWSTLRKINDFNFFYHNALVKKLVEIDAIVDNLLEIDNNYQILKSLYYQDKKNKVNKDNFFKYRSTAKKDYINNVLNHKNVDSVVYNYLNYLINLEQPNDQIGSYIKPCISQNVISKYNNDLIDVNLGKKSIATYSQTQPIPFNLRSKKDSIPTQSWFSKYNNNYVFNFKWNSSSNIQLVLIFGKDKSNNKIIMDRLYNGDTNYKLSDSDIQIKGTEIYLLLRFTQTINNTRILNKNKVLGVDLGMKYAAVISGVDGKEYAFLGDCEFYLMKVKNNIEKNKRVAQRNSVYSKGGHGIKRKLQKLNEIKDKESQFRNTFNHTISSQIVNFAIKNGFGAINVEDLSAIPLEEKNKKTLRNWSYFDMLTKIEYKCKKNGIEFKKVNPAYTSQRCSMCGQIGNRVSQSIFVCNNEGCLNCNQEKNADLNAAINIAKL